MGIRAPEMFPSELGGRRYSPRSWRCHPDRRCFTYKEGGDDSRHGYGCLALTAKLGVVLVGARCFPGQDRPPVSHGIDPKKPHEGFGGQLFPVLPGPI